MTILKLIEKLLLFDDLEDEVWVATDCHGCFGPMVDVYKDDRGMIVVVGGDQLQKVTNG